MLLVAGTPSEIAGSLRIVSDAVPWCSFRVGVPPGEDGWLRCSDALRDASFFTRWQDLLAARLAREYGAAPAVTAAGYIMGWYCGMFGHLGGTLFHVARRVPSLAPENLAFRLDRVRCRPVEVALLDGAFHCLPSDPCGPPRAVGVADEPALAALLRAEVAGHGERFVAAYRGASRFGPRTLWGAVTDSLDRGLWHVAHQRGDDAAGAADAAMVLPRRLAPFTSGSTIRVAPDGRWTRTRQSCCFHYKLPGVPGPCPTCPRLA